VLHGSVEFSKPGFVAGDGRFVLFCRPIEIDGGQHECLAMYEGCRRRATAATAPLARNIFQTALSWVPGHLRRKSRNVREPSAGMDLSVARTLMCELVVLILGENSLRIPIGEGPDDLLAGTTDPIKRCK